MKTPNQPPSGKEEYKLHFPEQAEVNWNRYLTDFREQVYPNVFEKHGFTFQEAFTIWMLNKVNNMIGEIADFIEKEKDA